MDLEKLRAEAKAFQEEHEREYAQAKETHERAMKLAGEHPDDYVVSQAAVSATIQVDMALLKLRVDRIEIALVDAARQQPSGEST
jgi:hypothetical protein